MIDSGKFYWRSYRDRWNDLAKGNVFRSWSWLITWWKYYGENNMYSRTLSVFLLFDGDAPETAVKTHQTKPNLDSVDSLVAILPCYLEQSLSKGCALTPVLGDGEVCSDYLGIISPTDREEESAKDIRLIPEEEVNSTAGISQSFRLSPKTTLGMNTLIDELFTVRLVRSTKKRAPIAGLLISRTTGRNFCSRTIEVPSQTATTSRTTCS